MSVANWDKRAFCPCGTAFQAPFGKLFHVDEVVCPSCGRDKHEFEVKTARWVPAVRVGFRRRLVTEAHWEMKPPCL